MTNEINTVIRNILDQAEVFLNDAGEFYPFGSTLNADSTISPVGVHMETEHPKSQDVLNILIKSMIDEIKNKEAIVIGIGVDVLYKPNDESEKIDALQIMILTNEESKNYFFPYKKLGDHFVFETGFIENGTLHLD